MPSGELPGMTRELMVVEYPSTTRLSQSSTPGGYSALARDDENGLNTHAVLFPAGDEIDRVRAEGFGAGYADGAKAGLTVGVVAGTVVTLLALKAVPHVKSRFAELRAKLGRKPEVAIEVLPEEARPEIEAPRSENWTFAIMAE